MKMIAYIRVSSVGGRDTESERYQTEAIQAEEIERWGRERGVEIAATYVDRDVSGAKDARPGFEAAMDALRAGRGDGIVVATLDRFSRQSTIDALKRVQDVQDAGGTVASVGGEVPVDPTTPAGEFQLTIFAAIARMQWREYDRRWKVAKRRAAERGVQIARAPLGYVHGADGRLVPGPLAAQITEMFRVAAEEGKHAALRYIQAADAGAPARRWTMQNLRRTLERRVYLGEASYNGGTTVQDAHEPLTDLATWTRAQSDPKFRRSANAAYPLSGGPACCASCGTELVGGLGGAGGARKYRCATGGSRRVDVECQKRVWIDADALEAYVLELVVLEAEAREADPESYPEILPEVSRNEAAQAAERAFLEAQIRRDEFASAELDISPEAWAARVKALDAVVAESQARYEEAVLAAGPLGVIPRSEEIRASHTAGLPDALQRLGLRVRVDAGRGSLPERVSLVALD